MKYALSARVAPSQVVLVALLVFISVISVCGKPTIYKRNNNDKLEPVLVPVSSTVIPLPVYKVAYGIGINGGDKLSKPSGSTKLITVNKKKAPRKADWAEASSAERNRALAQIRQL